jgi:peptidoglycan/xylan/chitin deacetylase (PgdA/CDA1 family)
MVLERPTWPGGARCAVTLTFDNFGEALDLRRYGHAAGASADGVYAPRRGVGRILDMLERHGIKATFFVEGWNARKYAAQLREVADRGHEVGAHGWLHEEWGELKPKKERDLIRRTTEALADALGRPPRGWRSPGGLMTPRTLGFVREAGYLYDSSFADEDVPYLVGVDAARPDDRIVELPWTWALDDAPFYGRSGMMVRPTELAGMWMEEFDAAYRLTGCFMVVCHPRFSGRPAHALGLERVVEHVERHEGIWFARCEDVAAHVVDAESTPPYAAPEVVGD